ncbi:MAG: hypothetical protein GXN94_00790 [Aquificae bacterium]|nr:hypothetical protein [Aquificota bacterium]
MKDFKEALVWNWHLLKCCGRMFFIVALYVFLFMVSQFFFLAGLVQMVLFTSFSLFIASIFDISRSEREYAYRFKTAPFSVLFTAKLPQTFGLILAWFVVFGLFGLSFYFSFMMTVSGEIFTMGAGVVFIFVIAVLLSVVVYASSYAWGKVALKSSNFSEAFFYFLEVLKPSIWKKVLFNKKYFFLQLKLFLFLFMLFLFAVAPLIFVAPSLDVGELIIFVILVILFYSIALIVFVFYLSSLLMPAVWSLSYRFVEGEERQEETDTPDDRNLPSLP